MDMENIVEMEGEELLDEEIEDENDLVEEDEKVLPVVNKHRVKIDGEELDVELEELINNYQRAQASQKRFDEAARTMKQVEEMFARGRNDPAEILNALGVDPLEFLESFVTKQIEEDSLSPEEKELRELRALKAERDAELQKAEQNRIAQERQRQADAFAQQIDNDITAALAEAGLKPTPKIIARVAEQLLADLSAGKELNARSALTRTQNDIQSELAAFLADNPEHLLGKADKKQVAMLRRHFMKDVTTFSDESPVQERQASKKKVGKSIKDVFGDLNLM